MSTSCQTCSNIFKRRYDIFLARKSAITNRHLLNRKTFSTRGFRFDSIAARISRKRGNNFISSTFGCFFREFAIFFVNSTSGEKKKKSGARSYRREIDPVGSDSVLLSLCPSLVSLWNKVTRLEKREGGVGTGMKWIKIVRTKYWYTLRRDKVEEEFEDV